MKPQSLIMLVVAGACGLAAMVLTQRFLSAPTDKKLEDMATVVVAKVEIQGGTPLNDTMLKTMEYPKALLPEGAYTDVKEVVGRAIRFPMSPSEVLTSAKLAPEGVKAGLETVIEEGKRAIAVASTTDKSVAGFIKPNSHVDVMLNMPQRGPAQPGKNVMILQDIKVLAVNSNMQNSEDPDTKGKVIETVTLSVTPDECQVISLAQSSGTLHLVLRSGVDREEVASKALTLDDVLSGKKRPSKVVAKKDEKGVFLEKDKVAVNKNKLGSLQKLFGLKGADENSEESEKPIQKPKVVAAAPVAPPVQVPQRVLKRLVYRDLEGKPLMEVLVDADSMVAARLRNMLEEVEPANLAGLASRTVARPVNPPIVLPLPPVTQEKSRNTDPGD